MDRKNAHTSRAFSPGLCCVAIILGTSQRIGSAAHSLNVWRAFPLKTVNIGDEVQTDAAQSSQGSDRDLVQEVKWSANGGLLGG